MSIKVIVAAAVLATGASGAMASFITLVGGGFDVTYEPAVQGPYGTPTIVGNSIHWTPLAAFFADSSGVDSFSALTQLDITAHTGYQLTSFGYQEDGHYDLSNGSGDPTNISASVSGVVNIKPLISPNTTTVTRSFATGDFTVTGSHSWVTGLATPITLAAGSTKVSFDVTNALDAIVFDTTQPDTARVSKANVKLEVRVDVYTPPVHAVPEPETYAMVLAGLCAAGLMSRRRGQSGRHSV